MAVPHRPCSQLMSPRREEGTWAQTLAPCRSCSQRPSPHREEETWAQTLASAANTCRVCKRPFLGGLLGHALECRGCAFIACHSCAANQADWDTRTFGCTAGRNAKTYLDFSSPDEHEQEEVPLPAGAQREHAAAMRRHDLLWDCIQELRASTRRYHAALNASFAEYRAELRAAMPFPEPRNPGFLLSPTPPAEEDDAPPRLRELLRERLAGVTAVLAEQAAAAAELTRQVFFLFFFITLQPRVD